MRIIQDSACLSTGSSDKNELTATHAGERVVRVEIAGGGVAMFSSRRGVFHTTTGGRITTITETPLVPLMIFQCEGDSEAHISLGISRPGDGDSLTEIIVPYSAILNPSMYRENLSELSRYIKSDSRSRVLNLLAKSIESLWKYLPKAEGYNIAGWHGDKFITPISHGYIGNSVTRNSKSGDHEIQRKCLREIAINHPNAAAIMAVAVAGFLMPRLRVIDHSPILHIYGRGGIGKSTLAKIIASLTGDPLNGGIGPIAGWDSSNAGLENILMALNHQFIILDDSSLSITGSNKQQIAQKLFKLANGGGRIMARQNGAVRDIKSWNLQFISTGNTPLSGLIGKNDGLSDALLQRITDIHVSADRPIFNTSDHDKTLFMETIPALNEHYGHFLQPIIDDINKNIDEIARSFNEGAVNFFHVTKNSRKANVFSAWFEGVGILSRVLELSDNERYKIEVALNNILCEKVADENEDLREISEMISSIITQKLKNLKFRAKTQYDRETFNFHNREAVRNGVIGEIVPIEKSMLTSPDLHEISPDEYEQLIIYDTQATREELGKIGIDLGYAIEKLKSQKVLVPFESKKGPYYRGNVAYGIRGWRVDLIQLRDEMQEQEPE